MGIYNTYSLSITPEEATQAINNYIEEKQKDEKHNNAEGYAFAYGFNSPDETKWADWEEALTDISEHFPKVLIELHVDASHSLGYEGFSVAYAYGGSFYEVEPVIPKFDPKLLPNYPVGIEGLENLDW